MKSSGIWVSKSYQFFTNKTDNSTYLTKITDFDINSIISSSPMQKYNWNKIIAQITRMQAHK
jgi:hypothetical protein